MKVRIKDRRGRSPILWCGIDSSVIWFDLNSFFSIDLGKWFIRLFFQIGNFNFCRYLGMIKHEPLDRPKQDGNVGPP